MLPKGPYDPNKTEKEILDYWLENDYFKPEFRSEQKLSTAYVEGADKRETYTNILPPPNANGNLHLGHMSGYAYQDLMGRYNRMKGKAVLLLPGKDHAGIQTEVVFEKVLEKEGKTKKDMGRKKFYEECYKFCMENSETAREQEKNLGLSADFDRELFTLDPKIVKEVLQTFIDLYDDGLVYRDKRLINWCVRCQTALADIDTEYKESTGKLFYFKYGFTEPDPYAVEIKNKYAGEEIEVLVERNKGMKYKNKEGEEFKWEFDYYGSIPNETNPADNSDLDVILIGFDDLEVGDKVKGKTIGLMLRLDKDFKLIVINPDNSEVKLDEELDKHFHRFSKYFAGVHIRLFDEYPDDKYYNLGFILATTRPETKFGDTALCVNPKDERYKDWVGKEIEVQTLIGNAKLNIIADEIIDPEFGTGIMKVTPAHAPDDWDIAMKHPEVLPEKQCIGFDGKLNHICGKYEGMKALESRQKLEEDMKKQGILVNLNGKYKNRIQICERCKNQIEPLISHQWFVDTDPLKEKAKQLVKDDFTNIMPEGKENVYLNWMDTPEDWCITRQLWWGYRVPVWYKIQPKEFVTETGEVKERFGEDIMHSMKDYKEYMKVQVDDPGDKWVQDEDVFDTWFSSGQWPVVTLLAKDGDFEKFYPTQIMETGWDILIFWVTRMMLLCPYKAKSYLLRDDKNLDLTDKEITPFQNVYLHGLVLDREGVKMSKSKGNGIDPFKMMHEFGTDALRLSFVIGNKVGQNYRLYEEKIESFRNYCNKIWNISKFTLMNIGDEQVQNFDPDEIGNNMEKDDKKMIKHIDKLIENSTRNMDNFNFGVVAQELYESIWHEFADVYLETIKPRIYTKDRKGNPINTSDEAQDSRKAALWTLWYCLDKYLRLLHPFIPFITEKIWQEFPKKEEESETLMYAKWPN
ncbi:class I tRNA ligase family protein [Candidatus Dojkabacteria bacterium]|nr:class I tRNA ligase family protein [Candidatus Dojkabacteria bacterium]